MKNCWPPAVNATSTVDAWHHVDAVHESKVPSGDARCELGFECRLGDSGLTERVQPRKRDDASAANFAAATTASAPPMLWPVNKSV
jgi:hypothetical protein